MKGRTPLLDHLSEYVEDRPFGIPEDRPVTDLGAWLMSVWHELQARLGELEESDDDVWKGDGPAS